MRQSLQSLCDGFIENRGVIKSAFPMESEYINPACAAVFTYNRQVANTELLKSCNKLLKDETSVFSNFRGIAKSVIVSMMAASADANELLKNAVQAYDALRAHFPASQQLTFVSAIIAKLTEPFNFGRVAERTKHIYSAMKSNHPLLTSGEDCTYAAMLALSNLQDEQIATDTERCYELLKPELKFGNAVQALSHALAFGERTAEEKCNRTLALYNQLKDRECNFGYSYELAMIGVLALLSSSDYDIINDVCEVNSYLSGQKGYGFWGAGKKQRLMHSAMLVASEHIGNVNNPMLCSVSFGMSIPLIVAQQIAISAAIAAASHAS